MNTVPTPYGLDAAPSHVSVMYSYRLRDRKGLVSRSFPFITTDTCAHVTPDEAEPRLFQLYKFPRATLKLYQCCLFLF